MQIKEIVGQVVKDHLVRIVEEDIKGIFELLTLTIDVVVTVGVVLAVILAIDLIKISVPTIEGKGRTVAL